MLINHGGTEMGQGLHTKMIQVAATTSASRSSGSGSRRPAPTRCPTPPPRRPAPARTSTAERSRTPASRSWSGWTPSDAGRDIAWEDLVREAYFSRVQLWAAGFYRTEGLHWDSTAMHGHPFKYFAYGAAATEVEVDGFTGAYRTRRVDIVHDVGDSLSPLVDLGQIEGGFVQGAGWLTLEDLRWDESDGPRRGPADHPGRQHLQAAQLHRDARGAQRRAAAAGPRGRRGVRLQGRRRAAADAGVLGARGAAPGGRRVRSARHVSVDLASPATPEAVYWAIQQARRGSEHGHVADGPARRRTRPAGRRRPAAPPAVRAGRPRRRCPDALGRRGRTAAPPRRPGVLVTVVRGARARAPRRRREDGRVRRRRLGERRGRQPRGDGRRPGAGAARRTGRAARADDHVLLNDKARTEHGVQCCGGEVTAAARAAARWFRRSRSSGSVTSGSSWPGSWPATTSTCTWSTPGPTSSTAERLACLDDGQAAVHVTTRRCPSWCSARCPGAPTCW